MLGTMLSVLRDRAWSSGARLIRAAPRTKGPRERRTSFYDVVVVVCFLTLIGIAMLGGVVMLFSWVTATFSASSRGACPEFEGCVQPDPDDHQGVSVDEHRTDDPMLTR
jgi:hypothetical protein